MPLVGRTPPPLNAIGLAGVTELFNSEIAPFIVVIAEIASAYVAIAASNRVKRMHNGNLTKSIDKFY